MPKKLTDHGYSLIELIVVLIIIGFIATVALKSLSVVNSTSRTEETKEELDRLAAAIAGDPSLVSGGTRLDFGYVGDVGSMPANLAALITNPGGYATWKGPYLQDKFTAGGADSYYNSDAWGKAYTYGGGYTITSSGGPSTLTKKIANSVSDLLYNPVQIVVTDIAGVPPGSVYKDSVRLVLVKPNGVGGLTTISTIPASDGYFLFDSIPVGTRSLSAIYIPGNDTARRQLIVNPTDGFNGEMRLSIRFPFSGGGGGGGGSGSIQYVGGTATTTGGDCDKFTFDITNTSGSPITLSNMTVTWASPTAYYKEIIWAGNKVVEQENPRISSGQLATFNSNQTIGAGSTVTLEIKGFKDSPTGGNDVNMSNTDMTVTFSDGSTITFNTGACI